jgi:hypothetical protein
VTNDPLDGSVIDRLKRLLLNGEHHVARHDYTAARKEFILGEKLATENSQEYDALVMKAARRFALGDYVGVVRLLRPIKGRKFALSAFATRYLQGALRRMYRRRKIASLRLGKGHLRKVSTDARFVETKRLKSTKKMAHTGFGLLREAGIAYLRPGPSRYNEAARVPALRAVPPLSTTLRRYPKVSFPATCTVGRPVRLSVDLRLRPPKSTAASGVVDVPFAPSEDAVLLSVVVSASGFDLDRQSEDMLVPRTTRSQRVTFTLRPAEPGLRRVEIEFYKNAVRVGYLSVGTQALLDSKPTRRIPDRVALFQTPSVASLDGRSPIVNAGTKYKTLHYQWNEGARTRVMLLDSAQGPGRTTWYMDSDATSKEVLDTLGRLTSFMNDSAGTKYTDASKQTSREDNIVGLGISLFERVLPGPVQEELRAMPDGSVLCVSTDEQWVPWEILHDGSGYLGQRFCLFRLPRVEREGHFGNRDEQTGLPSEHRRLALHIVGVDIPEEIRNKAAAAFSALGDRYTVEPICEKPLSVLIDRSADADLLHLTCHGTAEPSCCLFIADTKEPSQNLLVTSLKIPRFRVRPTALVFANACNSAAPQVTFGHMLTFAWAFWHKGVNTYIGTTGVVPAPSAVAFASAFYREAFSRQKPAAEAFRAAKAEMIQAGDYSHVLYALYGSPEAVLAPWA